jgi:hypothetical protein
MLATEISIHTSSILMTMVVSSVVRVDTSQKNEDTWCGALMHYDAK